MSATWLLPSVTTEGETYIRLIPISFSAGFGNELLMPVTVTHCIDDTASPLAPFCDDIAAAPGVLRVTVTATDQVLRAGVADSRIYPLSQALTGRWKDVIVRSLPDSYGQGMRPCADLAGIDTVLPMA